MDHRMSCWGAVAWLLGGCYEGVDAGPRGHVSSEYRGAQMPACGTPLAEVDGVWAYSNGEFTATGESCAGTNEIGALEFQCVEIAQRYMNERFEIQPLWDRIFVAADMCTPENLPPGVSRHWSGDVEPQHGDLAVWTDDGYGHVAVVRTVWPDAIEIVEQNSNAEGTRTLWGDAVGGYFSAWGSSPDCFVRADAAAGDGGGIDPAPQDEGPDDPIENPTGGLSIDALMALAHDAGIPCESLVDAVAIAIAESGGYPDASYVNGVTSGCPSGSIDRGLWQINDCYHAEYDDACTYDAACNATAMAEISGYGTDWTPWVAYNDLLHLQYRDLAQAAYDQGVGDCGGGGPGDESPEASCAALDYWGACYGETSMWWEAGACRVRDCAAEGRECGLISQTAGLGCQGGSDGSTAFDCATLGYEGACMADDTLVWVDAGACRVAHCPDTDRSCAWTASDGYNCVDG